MCYAYTFIIILVIEGTINMIPRSCFGPSCLAINIIQTRLQAHCGHLCIYLSQMPLLRHKSGRYGNQELTARQITIRLVICFWIKDTTVVRRLVKYLVAGSKDGYPGLLSRGLLDLASWAIKDGMTWNSRNRHI